MAGISVILPSLNVKSYIRQCIESVLDQTYTDLEIICVDAGSSDGTYEILEEYAKRDSRIVLLKSEIKSYGAQVNTGIRTATGKYIAIVDTDDFIQQNMYQELFDEIEQNELDLIKGDWEFLITEKDKDFYVPGMTLGNHKELYNKILCIDDAPYLYYQDLMVWKGLYKRQFLVENNILFHESKGAANQDYGFNTLVLSYAKKMMFVNKYYYKWRYRRPGSSSVNMNALRYVYQEWKRLLEEKLLPKDSKNWPYIYHMMIHSFLAEYDRAVRKNEYRYESEYITPYYDWFKECVNGIQSDDLNEEVIDHENFEQLEMLLKDQDRYAKMLQEKDSVLEKKRVDTLQQIGNQDVVIFGSGTYGIRDSIALFMEGIHVDAFCDNDQKKWNQNIGEIKIYSVENCTKMFAGHTYLVENKKYAQDMRQQLLEQGIPDEQIYIMPINILYSL